MADEQPVGSSLAPEAPVEEVEPELHPDDPK